MKRLILMILVLTMALTAAEARLTAHKVISLIITLGGVYMMIDGSQPHYKDGDPIYTTTTTTEIHYFHDDNTGLDWPFPVTTSKTELTGHKQIKYTNDSEFYLGTALVFAGGIYALNSWAIVTPTKDGVQVVAKLKF